MVRKNQKLVLFEEEDVPVRPTIWRKKGVIVSIVFGIIWIFFVINYLCVSGWWASRSDLSPAELVGGLGGLCLPMLIVWLVSAYFDRSEQLTEEAETLRGYLNELVYPTEEGAIYTKTLTDALRLQIQEFRGVFNEVNEQTQSVRDDLKHWISDLGTIISHVDTQTVASVREIAGHIQNLSEAIAGATEQTQRAANLFSEQAIVLQRITEQSVSETENISQNLSGQVDHLQSLINAIDAVNSRIGTATNQAGQTTQDLAVAAQKIEAAVDIYEADSHKQNARLFGNLEKVLSVFRAQGELLDQEVGKIANRIAVVESGMLESARRLEGTAVQAVSEFENAGGALTQQTEDFRSAIMVLKSDLSDVRQQMETIGRKMVARSLLNNIENKDMLAEAAAILDQLQSLSVDMAHLFSPKLEEDLWKRYYDGDKTVFMRHIRSELGSGTAKKMKEMYQNNRSFRKAAQGYMNAFEKMTQQVGQDDSNKLLLSIVIGSDAGRLYMVLADVLKGNQDAD